MFTKKQKILAGVLSFGLVAGIANPAFATSYSGTASNNQGVVVSKQTTGVVLTAPAKNATANPTSSTIYVDGQDIAFEAYNINGNNYFKLRDVAWALSGTSKQFNVTWDEEKQVINLVSGEEYPKTGVLKIGDNIVKSATLNTAPIMKDGDYVNMTAYNINGNNFFKLRDLGTQFDFAVGWNGDANAVSISTTGEIEEEEQTKEEQKQETISGVRWDLISTEWCTADLISGEKYGLPSYMIVYKQPDDVNGFKGHVYAIDARTGRKYPLDIDEKNNGVLQKSALEEIQEVMIEKQTFKEEELHSFPKVGDTVIKKDGTEIILTATIIGTNQDVNMLLGFEQGVDVITGVKTPMGYLKDYSAARDGFYKKSELTNEMFTNVEWHAITAALSPNRKYIGDYDGEIYHTYWKWNANAKQFITGEQGRWDWLGPKVSA